MDDNKIPEQELREINSVNSIYCNKFYFMQNNALIKIVGCEAAPDLNHEIKARFSVAMTVPDFFALYDAMKVKMEDINRQIAAAQTGKKA